MTATTDNFQTVIDVATRAAIPNQVEPGNIYALVDNEGRIHELNLDRDEYRTTPRRKTGTIRAHDANAFVHYVKDQDLGTTHVWADEENTRVIAILNGHQHDNNPDAGWNDHRALLAVRKTDAWKAWITLDRQWLKQDQFAEHIEDRAIDIVEPASAIMLELVQSFQATLGGTFESSKRLSSGETQLVYKEEVNAKAGQRGQLEIPNEITLALRPFQGARAYKVTARFRYRIKDGGLFLSYALDRPDDVIREAFADVVTLISGDLETPVLNGWPE